MNCQMYFRTYGTESIDDLINVCFGKDYTDSCSFNNSKYDVLQKIFPSNKL